MNFLKKFFSNENKNIETNELKIADTPLENNKNEIPDEILVSIFAACLMSYDNNRRRLIVKSFKRVNSNSPVWNMAGRHELTKS